MAKRIVSGRSRNPASEVSGDLQRLGFSEYEARTYLALLKLKPATAYEISREAGLPRSNTYSALESLTKKLAVQPVSESPVRYVPVEPAVLLGRMSREVKDVCERLKNSLRGVAKKEESDFVWRVEGAASVDGKIKELIDGAQQHIWIKAAADVLRAHAAELKRAAARNVHILIILFGSDPTPFMYGRNCQVYLHEGNGVRMGGADNLFTITVDYKAALTASVAGDVVGAFTRSEPIVRMAETLIRHDYYIAEIFNRFGEEIDAAFGPYLLSLRRKTFSPEQLALLERNLKQGSTKDDGAGPSPQRGRRNARTPRSRVPHTT